MPEQLDLFTTDTTITELCVDALQGDPDRIRDAARALITLIRYHDRKDATNVTSTDRDATESTRAARS